MGPSILIATALIVAVRTAKWATRPVGDPLLADVDHDLDREISFAARISMRFLHELMNRRQGMFPGSMQPIYDGIHEEDVQT